MKRAPEKILTEMLATGGREGKTIAIVQKYNLNNIFHEIEQKTERYRRKNGIETVLLRITH